jgi:multidrug efflux system membrane fusion protein
MRSVTTGRQDEASVVILSGVKPGETVVVSGFSRLSDGAKVRVIDNGGSENAGVGGQDASGKGRPASDMRSNGAPR